MNLTSIEKKDKQFISLKICSCEKLRTADRLNEKGRWPPLWDPTWRPFTYTAPVQWTDPNLKYFSWNCMYPIDYKTYDEGSLYAYDNLEAICSIGPIKLWNRKTTARITL